MFLAHITRLDELPRTSTSPAMAKATYRLLTSFKGDIRSVGSVRTGLNNCHATLLPGGDYILFARRDAKTGDLIVAPGFRGTRQFFKGADESERHARAIRNSISKSSNSKSSKPHP
ncbi:MAG: hypothetical protein IT473_03015 [Lysobacter sp.]|nr:hypothetical protein [Lysobacter sp.]